MAGGVTMDEHPVSRIATIEVPVRDLERAVAWYQRALGLQTRAMEGRSAVLRLTSPHSGGCPHLLLVETNDARRLAFASTQTGIVHNVIDFVTPDPAGLHARLKAMKAEVDVFKPGAGGFGFRDPDGNRLGACGAGPP